MDIDSVETVESGHRIRPLRSDDADWITEACQDEVIQRWTTVPSPYRRSDAVEFLSITNPAECHWAICAADGRPVGAIGARHLGTPTPDIGYYVAPWGRREGAARTAIGLVVDEIARRGGVVAVHALIAETNEASQGAARSAGFRLIGDSGDECPDSDRTVRALLFERRV